MTHPYFISATFQTCFFSAFSSFNDEKGTSITKTIFGECVKHLNVKIRGYIGMSPLSEKYHYFPTIQHPMTILLF